MPGTITFRPIEANLAHDTDWLGKMDPYCMFTLGTQKVRSQVCKHGGTRPHWQDAVTMQSAGLPSVVRLDVMDKDKIRPDDSIASADLDLTELQSRGSISRWFPVYHRKKLAGEVLIEATYQGEPMLIQQPIITQQIIPTTTVLPTQTFNQVPIETLGQQQFIGQSYEIPTTTTFVQGTNLGFDSQLQGGLPLNQGFSNLQQGQFIQGQNLGLDTQLQSGLPLNQGFSNLQQGQFIQGQNLGLQGQLLQGQNLGLQQGQLLQGQNAGLLTNPNAGLLASDTSALGPQGLFPHGHKKLGGATNAGYSERPGYTLGTIESNPTCQSNLDTNGGGFFNKPGRERRAEPYTLSNNGTYGIPHGQTVDATGHLQPNTLLERPAPIGQFANPGITGYPDGFNHGAGALPAQNLNPGAFPARDKI